MQFLLLVICLLTALPVSAGCPPLIPAENLWQLTAGVYCLASKIDFEIQTLECSFIDGACSCVDASTSVLSTLDELILSDVDSVSSKVDVLLECTLGTQITQAMIPYTISQPGHYYLCDSVSSTGADAITINASDVYLNLNGFTVSSTDLRAITTGGGSYSNIAIENGSIASTSPTQRTMVVTDTTNLTVRNVAMSATLVSVCLVDRITDLVMEDCYVTANGTGGHGLEANLIKGGRIENVYVYNTPASGIRASTPSSSATLECINCIVDVANFGFVLLSPSGIILRDCVSSGAVRGYQVEGGHVLENCVAHDHIIGFVIENAANALLRNCIAKSSVSGFVATACTEIVFEGCISSGNSGLGFDLAATGNTGCVFAHCAAYNNGSYGFYVSNESVSTLIAYSTAFGNGDSGIYNGPDAIDTFVINCRSQHDSMCCNPAYNLNGNPDILNGATEIVES